MMKLTPGGKINFILPVILLLTSYSIKASAQADMPSGNLSQKNSQPDKTSSNLFDIPEGKDFKFPGGFYLSGFTNGRQWGNGIPSQNVQGDYLPGPIGLFASDNHYYGDLTFMVTAQDTPFGQSWQMWKSAVAAGADFYDGDRDGLYDPVDKNGNGVWDANEDRPDACGQVSYWRVDNDGVNSLQRKFNDVDPQFIEVQRTATISSIKGGRVPMLYVRFRIINTGQKAEVLDSVYFSIVSPSITEEASNYLAGCDTSSGSVFAYSTMDDAVYQNPPCYLISFLQGPLVSLPGVTFIDVNSNGVFDPGIDSSIKKGFNRKGRFKGLDSIPGSMNLEMTGFTPYYPGSVKHGEPNTQYELRNYMVGGLTRTGEPIDPCNWGFGNSASLADCKDLNPKFLYSGNPVENKGWLNTVSGREVLMMSAGPFKLVKNVPQDIYVTYVVGQGYSPVNSIEIARNTNIEGRKFFDKNLGDEPLAVEDEIQGVKNYNLEQNYPNPFNPATTIRYSVAEFNRVTLKVYDLLGKEVASLVNEEKRPGSYTAVFNASNLASGIYFYRLQAGSKSFTRKLLLVK